MFVLTPAAANELFTVRRVAGFLECVRKSVERFSDKTHDKTKS